MSAISKHENGCVRKLLYHLSTEGRSLFAQKSTVVSHQDTSQIIDGTHIKSARLALEVSDIVYKLVSSFDEQPNRVTFLLTKLHNYYTPYSETVICPKRTISEKERKH
jgi:hypothetical protein